MRVAGEIVLDPLQIILLGLVCFYAIWKRRPEIALAVYLSMSLWSRPVLISGISSTWPVMATVILAGLRYAHVDRRLSFVPARFNATLNALIPSRDSWVLLLMIFWWAWALLDLFMFNLHDKINIYRPLLIYIVFGCSIALMFAANIERVRYFAVTYLITSIVGLYLALRHIDVPLSYLLEDPGFSNSPFLNMGLVDYHFFSHHLGIAFIMAVALFLQARSPLTMLLYLAGGAVCAYALLLVGARQSISGVGIVLALMVIWILSRRGPIAFRVVFFVSVIASLVLVIYQLAPHLILREGETSLNDSFNIFADRGGLWLIGWGYFLTSPVWGLGFEQKMWSHNLFVGTLADQGLVGMTFFVGYLVWVGRRLPSVLKQTPDDPRAIWRTAMLGVFLFAMIHGQGSGNTMYTTHLYWPMIFGWALGEGVHSERPAHQSMPALALASPASSQVTS